MSKSLVIVESPAKAKTLRRFLGKGFEVTASMGHVRDLPEKELGVDVENDFRPTYVTNPDKEKTVRELKRLVKQSDTIYLAPDPDREGEAISWHLAELLKSHLNGKQVKRISFNEITRQAVQGAVHHPGDINMALVNAQQARRILDRLVGYKISPMLTRLVMKNKGSLSAGRVQSVALRLVCEREEEIRNFVVVEYWTLHGEFNHAHQETLWAELYQVDGRRISHQGEDEDSETKEDSSFLHIQTREQADALRLELQKESYRIDQIDSRKKKRRAPPPYITSTLQQDASRLLGFTGDRTMRAAQSLYEGIDIGEETAGLVTYIRTDSVRIAQEAIQAGRAYIAGKYGEEYLPESPNFFRTSKAAQDAHEAIRPTYLDEKHSPSKMKKYLNGDQAKLYEMIWKRFVACQMKPAEYLMTTIQIAGQRFMFRATGSILTFAGYTKVYRDAEEESEQRLPTTLEAGQSLQLNQVEPRQHFTRPPARYNDASLIRELEKDGIGRPSTYATIIKTLVNRRYIERREKRFFATDLGEVVNKLLVKNFQDIFDVGFTAGIEARLDDVEEGITDWVQILREFYTPFANDLNKAPEGFGETLRSMQEATDKTCRKCGKPVVKKWGRTGWFLACTGYPDCDYTSPLEVAEVELSDIPCDKCGEMMVIRTSRDGKYLACSNYPKCKTTRPLPTGIPCPMEGCKGDVVKRRSKRGIMFYGCSRYPNCNFVAWDIPVLEPCPDCGNPFLVRKDYKRKGPTLKCPNKECSYSRPDVETASSSSPSEEDAALSGKA